MKAGLATAVIALAMPVCVFATTLRLSSDIDLLVLDGKKSPVRYYAVPTASNWITALIRWCSGWKKPSALLIMNNARISLPADYEL